MFKMCTEMRRSAQKCTKVHKNHPKIQKNTPKVRRNAPKFTKIYTFFLPILPNCYKLTYQYGFLTQKPWKNQKTINFNFNLPLYYFLFFAVFTQSSCVPLGATNFSVAQNR